MKPTYKKMYNTIIFFIKKWRAFDKIKRYYIDTLNYLIDEKYINWDKFNWDNILSDADIILNNYILTTKWKIFYNEYKKNFWRKTELIISDYKILLWGIGGWIIWSLIIELIKRLIRI